MDMLLKVLIAVLWSAALIGMVVALEKKIARLTDGRWQLLARATLYSVAFTPTAYHHAPNTIVAPLHLSTLCGNLFYSYDYTVSMFVYGVAAPLACGWALLCIIFRFQKLPRLS